MSMSKNKNKNKNKKKSTKERIKTGKSNSSIYSGLRDISNQEKGSPAYQKFRSFDIFRESITIMLVNFIFISLGKKSGLLAVNYGIMMFVILSSFIFGLRHFRNFQKDDKKILNIIFICIHAVVVLLSIK